MAVVLRCRTFTADEFERMAEAGVLTEDERVDLIDGEIVRMSPIGPSHAWEPGSWVLRHTTVVVLSLARPQPVVVYDTRDPAS